MTNEWPYGYTADELIRFMEQSELRALGTTPETADAIDEGLRDEAEGRLVDGPTALKPYLPNEDEKETGE